MHNANKLCKRIRIPVRFAFLMYEFGKLCCVVTKGMREGNRKLLLILLPIFFCRRLAPLLLGLLRRFQFGAHEWLTDLLFDSCTQLTWRIATECSANKLTT